jgi:hypothetical protein
VPAAVGVPGSVAGTMPGAVRLAGGRRGLRGLLSTVLVLGAGGHGGQQGKAYENCAHALLRSGLRGEGRAGTK